jgi:hypothetical protein
MRAWLPGYAVRLENMVGVGMPDVLWCPQGRVVFIELKVQTGYWITVRNSQMVFGLEVRKSVPDHQHLFVVATLAHPHYLCYTYNTIRALKSTAGSHKFTIDVYMRDAQPDYTWRGKDDVSDYLKGLEGLKASPAYQYSDTGVSGGSAEPPASEHSNG